VAGEVVVCISIRWSSVDTKRPSSRSLRTVHLKTALAYSAPAFYNSGSNGRLNADSSQLRTAVALG
jgi:hypothetical protein